MLSALHVIRMIYKAYDIDANIAISMSLLSLNSAIISICRTMTATDLENAGF